MIFITVFNFVLNFIAVHVGIYFTSAVHVVFYTLVGCHGYCFIAHLMSWLIYFSFTIVEFGMIIRGELDLEYIYIYILSRNSIYFNLFE
jgi:hypothetical protein